MLDQISPDWWYGLFQSSSNRFSFIRPFLQEVVKILMIIISLGGTFYGDVIPTKVGLSVVFVALFIEALFGLSKEWKFLYTGKMKLKQNILEHIITKNQDLEEEINSFDLRGKSMGLLEVLTKKLIFIYALTFVPMLIHVAQFFLVGPEPIKGNIELQHLFGIVGISVAGALHLNKDFIKFLRRRHLTLNLDDLYEFRV